MGRVQSGSNSTRRVQASLEVGLPQLFVVKETPSDILGNCFILENVSLLVVFPPTPPQATAALQNLLLIYSSRLLSGLLSLGVS